MNSYDIAVIGGDGTGEVTAENIKVLDAAGQSLASNSITRILISEAIAIFAPTVLPNSTSDNLRNFSAVILGAIGHPDVAPGVLEKGILLRLRFELEQYINLRPVKLFDERFCPLKDKPEDVDFVVVRENNENLLTSSGGFVFKTPNEVAIQESVNTRRGVERCLRYPFDYTQAAAGQAVDPLRQDERFDLRLRSLGSGISRDRRGGYRYQTRVRPRGRHYDVVREEPGVV